MSDLADITVMRLQRQNTLSERDFRFAVEQYGLYAGRVTEFQKEREVWIRHSIIATFAFFGWIGIYRDTFTMTFMLDMFQVQSIYFLPLIFNIGGALRFFFIQRDINRLVQYLAEMEREVLCLPDQICEAPVGRGIRDRHWHAPSIGYWVFIITLSALAAAVLSFHISL